jgi:hypothetical protein
MTAKPSCSAKTKSGRPCRGHPVRDTDPPLCPAHRGASKPPGAPPGNRNARKHGVYARSDEPPALPGRIRDLDHKIQSLSHYIDNLSDKEKRKNYAGLLALYGQLLSRLGRLMRDQRAITGEAAGNISGAIGQALDELSTHLGVELG